MTPSTSISGRLGMEKLKPSRAGGCMFSSIIPSGVGGGREGGREGRKVTQSKDVCAGEPELGTKRFPATG